VPLVGQLRIIHQGRFLEDNKALSEHKVAEGEQTAMHLIIKSEVAKPTGVFSCALRNVAATSPVYGISARACRVRDWPLTGPACLACAQRVRARVMIKHQSAVASCADTR
jgi:hypothetical protein